MRCLKNDNKLTSQIKLDKVREKSNVKLNKLLTKYKFPEEYEKTLEMEIVNYEYQKEFLGLKFKDKHNLKDIKLDSLRGKFEFWRETQIQFYETTVKKWNKISVRYPNLGENNFKNDFINYHFYINLPNPSEKIRLEIEKLSKLNSLKNFIDEIARKETERVFSKCSAVLKLDSIAMRYGRNELFKYLAFDTYKKLDSYSDISLVRDSDRYCEYAYNKGIEKQSEINLIKQEDQNTSLINKALEVGITKDVVNDILKLIEKRKNDLESLKNSKNEDDFSNLFENTAPKSKTEIKRQFSKKLSNLINKAQFSSLFGNEFEAIVNAKTKEKIEMIKKSYDISSEQEEKLKEMLLRFHYNEQVNTAYYSYDKNLKKQKNSGLRYHFESEFKSLMNSFGQSVKPTKKVDSRTFQWK